MALYTFFLRRHDGDATAFEVHDLLDDAAASAHAARVHAEHPSAAYVEAFRAGREVPGPSAARHAA